MQPWDPGPSKHRGPYMIRTRKCGFESGANQAPESHEIWTDARTTQTELLRALCRRLSSVRRGSAPLSHIALPHVTLSSVRDRFLLISAVALLLLVACLAVAIPTTYSCPGDRAASHTEHLCRPVPVHARPFQAPADHHVVVRVLIGIGGLVVAYVLGAFAVARRKAQQSPG